MDAPVLNLADLGSLLIIAIAVYYPRGVVGWLSDFVARRRKAKAI